MAKQTRVQKYKKLRSEIESLDTVSLEQIEKEARNKKNEIVRNSVKHASSNQNADVKKSTLTMSIDELLEGHSEYVGLKEHQREERKQLRKKQLFKILYVVLGMVLLVVIAIIVIAVINNI